MSGLVLQDVSVQLGGQMALHGLSLTLARGERVALVGANGSGKSTLLRVMNGVQAPDRGTVSGAAGWTQAMLFQEPFLLRCSVWRNVALALWLKGVAWRKARHQALLALEQVGLTGLADRRANVLSGGQRQRVALARAWALQPALLLLDEPTASLDPLARREVETLITSLWHNVAGTALVFASHQLGQVRRLATRVLYLEQGRLLADLPVDDFFNPAVLGARSPQAQAFVEGEMP